MLNFFKNQAKIAGLERRVETQDTTISNLKQDLAKYLKRIEVLKAEVAAYENRHNEAHREQPMTVDFANLDAFSIERNRKDGIDVTIIGHWVVSEDKRSTKEWYLYCSDETHAKLVAKFDQHIAAKDSK